MTATDIPVPLRPAASRSWRQTAAVLAPGLIYVGIQGVAVLVLWLFTHLNQRTFDLHAWDGNWYLAIARDGYGGVPTSMLDGAGHHTPYTAMAFFPGYPGLIHLVEPMEGGNFVATALTISILAGILAAFGVTRLATRVTGSRRAGVIASVLVAAAPMSIMYSMVYPEALFLAFALWALVGVLEKNWPLAGWCAALAGLVRLDAAAVILVVVVAAGIAVWRGQDRFRAIAAIVVAPAGLVGYLAWVSIVSHSVWTYWQVQAQGWDSKWDWGVTTLRWAWSTVSTDGDAFTMVVVAVMVVSLVLVILGFRRVPWPLWVYGAIVTTLVVGEAGADFAKVRLLLPATVVLLIPVAMRLHRARLSMLVTATGLMVVAGIWYSAYSLSVWHYGI